MMPDTNNYTLVDPANGNLAFKIFSFRESYPFDHIQRLNYYSIVLLTKGEASLKADFSKYQVAAGDMLFFTPYQPFMLGDHKELEGIVLHFHPDFYCIIRHQKEVACNGVLFNNIYQPPFIRLSAHEQQKFVDIITDMKQEILNASLAQYELLISYLKIFLINASRIKVERSADVAINTATNKEPFVLQQLKDTLEENYKSKHLPSDYAAMLNITPRALGKITKNHFNKTLTDLIAERIIIEAKRELYLTGKPVKQIAYELGFEDEYYFNRFFKKNADIPPKLYRETVGFNRMAS